MDPKWTWQECEAPEGLDAAGLGQTPHKHGERWYVKDPNTGKVLGANPIYVMKNQTASNPFAAIKPPTGATPTATLGAVLQQVGADFVALAGALPSPPPAEFTKLFTDELDVAGAYTKLVAYVESLEKEVASLKGQAAGATKPVATSSASTGMSKAAVAGLVGTAGAVVGFAGGFAAGRMTAPHAPHAQASAGK